MEGPEVTGEYKADGTYKEGRPVFRHSGGEFILSVCAGGWAVRSGVGGREYLSCWSAPTMCPADPKTTRDVKWQYLNQSEQLRYTEFGDISVTCNNCNVSYY